MPSQDQLILFCILPHVLPLLCAAGQQGQSEGRPPWDVAKRLLAWMFNGAE
jgi:hypothetical protein